MTKRSRKTKERKIKERQQLMCRTKESRRQNVQERQKKET
jgi:hypothetical protein